MAFITVSQVMYMREYIRPTSGLHVLVSEVKQNQEFIAVQHSYCKLEIQLEAVMYIRPSTGAYLSLVQ